MKFCFDNNLSPHLAHGLHELSRGEDKPPTVIHLTDRFSPDVEDTVWVPELAKEGGWIVISQDGFKKSKAERELLRTKGVSIYVLDPQWASKAHWVKAKQLVEWWPAILQHSGLTSHFAVRVPWRMSGQGRFEQIRV